MASHVFCGHGSTGHRPHARSCICRVAQPGGSPGSPGRSGNGAPVPAAVGVGMGQPVGELEAALQDQIVESSSISEIYASETNKDDLLGERNQLKLGILNAVAGTHLDSQLCTSSSQSHDHGGPDSYICRHRSWSFCHALEASESGPADRRPGCHESNARRLHRPRRHNQWLLGACVYYS